MVFIITYAYNYSGYLATLFSYLVKCCGTYEDQRGDYSKPTITQCSKMMFIHVISKSIAALIKCINIIILKGAAFKQISIWYIYIHT